MPRVATLSNDCDYEDIESVQAVGLHCGWAGKAEESGVWGEHLAQMLLLSKAEWGSQKCKSA